MALPPDEAYKNRWRLWTVHVAILASSLFATMLAATNIGYSPIEPGRVAAILIKNIPGLGFVDSSGSYGIDETIVMQIRLPRILAASLVGSSLAVSGVLLQGIFRNPMADPYVIGVSAGAAFGGALALLLGFGRIEFGAAALPLMAFTGATATVFLVYSMARVGPRIPVTSLLLSGIAVSVVLSAVVTFLLVFAGETMKGLLFWLMGGFSYVEWRELQVAAPVSVLGLFAASLFARDLNIMLLGEEQAQQLGVETERVKKFLIVLSSLITAMAVSISGLIGFVGLMVPHLLRLVVGPDHRVLIPASIFAGGIFLVACDAVARLAFSPSEIPVGIVTALSGGPFFIYLLRKRRGAYTF